MPGDKDTNKNADVDLSPEAKRIMKALENNESVNAARAELRKQYIATIKKLKENGVKDASPFGFTIPPGLTEKERYELASSTIGTSSPQGKARDELEKVVSSTADALGIKADKATVEEIMSAYSRIEEGKPSVDMDVAMAKPVPDATDKAVAVKLGEKLENFAATLGNSDYKKPLQEDLVKTVMEAKHLQKADRKLTSEEQMKVAMVNSAKQEVEKEQGKSAKTSEPLEEHGQLKPPPTGPGAGKGSGLGSR